MTDAQNTSAVLIPISVPTFLTRLRHWFSEQNITFLVTTVVIAYLVLVPVGTLVIASFRSNFLGFGPSTWTLNNYSSTLGASTFPDLIGTSLEYAGLVTVFATVIGMALAWLYVRTNTPAKWFALLVSLVPLIIPGLIDAAAWVLILSQNGPVNNVLHAIGLPRIPVYSMTSMVLVQTLQTIPLAFLMGMSMMGSMDRSLEEAAAASGASPRRTLRSVVFPLMRPGVLGAALLVFVLTISSFEVPQLIGVPAHEWVLTTEIYNATSQYPVKYGTVAVHGMVVLVMALLGLYLSRRLGGMTVRETVTGKGFRPTIIDLGRWRWASFAFVLIFGLLAVVLPVCALVWSSLLPVYQNPSVSALHMLTFSNYTAIFDTPTILNAAKNTIIIALLTGAITTLICVVAAYLLVKTKVRARRVLELLATAPIALPSVILGVSLLYWYLAAPLPVHLYGSIAILVIAFVTGALPFGLRFIEPAFSQISTELEEAAANSGATRFQVFTRIYLPLLRPALTAAFLYCFIIAFKELTSALFLYSQKSEVLAVSMYSMWLDGSYTTVCAIGTLMIIVLAIAVLLVRKLGSSPASRMASGASMPSVPVQTTLTVPQG
jgi:iron(III) transport system permease protein